MYGNISSRERKELYLSNLHKGGVLISRADFYWEVMEEVLIYKPNRKNDVLQNH